MDGGGRPLELLTSAATKLLLVCGRSVARQFGHAGMIRGLRCLRCLRRLRLRRLRRLRLHSLPMHAYRRSSFPLVRNTF